MAGPADIEAFLAERTIAVAGVSRTGRGFGASAYRALKFSGYRAVAVNPNCESIDGDPCYPNLHALPEPAGGVLIVVPPVQTEAVVKEAAAAGVRRVWMQQGAASKAAIRFCEQSGIHAVHGECILMFLEAEKFPHNLHRWIRRALGRLH